MKLKVSKLEGPQLDYFVAKADGITSRQFEVWFGSGEWNDYSPSTQWEQCGPIIAREGIALIPVGMLWPKIEIVKWRAGLDPTAEDSHSYSEMTVDPPYIELRKEQSGDTPLIAAMRCRVAIAFGDEVEIEP